MKTILIRLTSESPKLFRRLTKLFVALGAIGAGLLAAGDSVPNYATNLAGHLIVAGIIGTAISGLTVEDKSKLNQES